MESKVEGVGKWGEEAGELGKREDKEDIPNSQFPISNSPSPTSSASCESHPSNLGVGCQDSSLPFVGE